MASTQPGSNSPRSRPIGSSNRGFASVDPERQRETQTAPGKLGSRARSGPLEDGAGADADPATPAAPANPRIPSPRRG